VHNNRVCANLSLTEYGLALRAEELAFRDWWRMQQETNEDAYPDRLSYAEWQERLQDWRRKYRDKQCLDPSRNKVPL
jgi:hypothetical protein